MVMKKRFICRVLLLSACLTVEKGYAGAASSAFQERIADDLVFKNLASVAPSLNEIPSQDHSTFVKAWQKFVNQLDQFNGKKHSRHFQNDVLGRSHFGNVFFSHSLNDIPSMQAEEWEGFFDAVSKSAQVSRIDHFSSDFKNLANLLLRMQGKERTLFPDVLESLKSQLKHGKPTIVLDFKNLMRLDPLTSENIQNFLTALINLSTKTKWPPVNYILNFTDLAGIYL